MNNLSEFIKREKQYAAAVSRSLIDETPQGFVVMDLETTGLGSDAEFCQIGIIDSDGNDVLSTLVKPTIPIEPGASNVTGIYDSDVADRVYEALHGKVVVIYNVDFDWLVVERMFRKNDRPAPEPALLFCAMQTYARFYGQYSEYHGSFTWKKLTFAAARLGIPVIDAHDATADCRMTLKVVKAMADFTRDSAETDGEWMAL